MTDVFCRDNVTTGRSIKAGCPGVVTEKLCDLSEGMAIVTGQVTVTPAPTTQFGFDSTNGRVVAFTTTVNPDDTVSQTYTYQDDGTPMTNSGNFTPAAAATAQITTSETTKYATNTLAGDVELGRVIELSERAVLNDGVLDPASVQYWNMALTPPVDVTATVTVAPYQLASRPVRKALTGELLDVTGAVGVGLDAIPTFATYAEIYIDASADDTLIRWTKDGTTPADDNGEQENKGTTIKLLDRDEIDGFLALTIDATGTLDPALVASLTVNYWNVAPDED